MDEFEFLVDPKMDEYLQEHCSPADELLQKLYRETHVKILDPRMISGNYQGRFLQMISLMIKPARVLELGTFTGYSSICLCAGLQNEGELITIEHDRILEDIIEKYINLSDKSGCIKVLWGEAEEVLKPLEEESFDLIFMDADKENYPLYYPILKKKLKKGGWMLIDNVLWNGKVWDDGSKDRVTELLRKFNDMVQIDEEVENITLFLRDGMTIIRKK